MVAAEAEISAIALSGTNRRGFIPSGRLSDVADPVPVGGERQRRAVRAG